MTSGKQANPKRPIETYEHRDKERLNNPPVGLVTPDNDPDAGQKRTLPRSAPPSRSSVRHRRTHHDAA